MTIIVRAEFEALSDQVSAFRSVALALSDAASEEPGTLRYAWYAGDTPSTFVVIEEYVDDNAALVHNERCGDLLRQASELAQMKAVHLHGDLGPDLTAWVAEHAQAQAHPPVAGNV